MVWMFNVDHIIATGGILIISAIIFAESGLLVGFFLPGDTLLFGAGLAASQGKFSLFWLIFFVTLAAIAGDNVGYTIGKQAGPRIFKKEDGILFRQEYLQKSEVFYEKHGGKTIILARFTPIVRTFAPVVAGAGKMSRKKFIAFNIIGGFLWAGGMSTLGYVVGGRIPRLDQYIELVIIGVMVVSILLALGHILKNSKTRALLLMGVKSSIRKIFLHSRVN